jgi:hypothetical protein
MSKKRIEHELLHGHKGCGCQTAMLSEAVREAGMDPSSMSAPLTQIGR